MFIEVLPYIVGASVSPVMMIMAVILLSQRRAPYKQYLVYMLGALLSVVVIGSLLFFVMHVRVSSGRPTLSDALAHILIGLLLLWLAIRSWRKGGKTKPKKVANTAHYGRDFALGAGIMALNFDSLIMFVPAAIDTQSASLAFRLGILALLVIATMLPIWLPFLLITLLGGLGKKLLALLTKLMQAHGQQLSGAIVGLIALYVLYKGIIGL